MPLSPESYVVPVRRYWCGSVSEVRNSDRAGEANPLSITCCEMCDQPFGNYPQIYIHWVAFVSAFVCQSCAARMDS